VAVFGPDADPTLVSSSTSWSSAADAVVLHSTWRGLLSGVFGGLVISVAGAFSVAATDGAVGSFVLLAVGAVILLVVLLDFPISSSFDSDGVTRRPLLRRQRLSWDRVDQLTRTRPGIAARARSLAPGGLVAKVGRRRYLLVDQCESIDEFSALSDVMDELGDDVGFHDLIVPPTGTDPTWTYRRRRWQPQPD